MRATRHAGDGCAGLALFAQNLPQIRLKNVMRADFDQHIDAVRDHGADRVVKAHRHTHIVPPVIGVERFAGRFGAKHRRIIGNARSGRRNRTDLFQEVVLHGVENVAVEGVIEIEKAEEDLLDRQFFPEFDQRLLVACECDGGRCVDGGELNLAAGIPLDFKRPFRRNSGSRHPALAACAALRFGPGNDQQHGLAEIESAGNICGGDFADAVPGDGVGRQTRFLQAAP